MQLLSLFSGYRKFFGIAVWSGLTARRVDHQTQTSERGPYETRSFLPARRSA